MTKSSSEWRRAGRRLRHTSCPAVLTENLFMDSYQKLSITTTAPTAPSSSAPKASRLLLPPMSKGYVPASPSNLK